MAKILSPETRDYLTILARKEAQNIPTTDTTATSPNPEPLSGEQMLPCPFCGRDAYLHGDLNGGHAVSCRGHICGAFISGTPIHPALKRWNARASLPLTPFESKMLEALKAAEWTLLEGWLYFCPVCKASENSGHNQECALSAAIAEAEARSRA